MKLWCAHQKIKSVVHSTEKCTYWTKRGEGRGRRVCEGCVYSGDIIEATIKTDAAALADEVM